MAEDQNDILVVPGDTERALNTPTVIDAAELSKARLDERWREFCLNAERDVAETTRPRPRVSQSA